MTSGCTSCGGGGGAFGFGMSSFTAWFMIGSVKISMISSTSITSINGVVLMSHISSPESPPDIDMVLGAPAALLQAVLVRDALGQSGGIRLSDEPDLHDATTLDRIQHPAHGLEQGVLVG